MKLKLSLRRILAILFLFGLGWGVSKIDFHKSGKGCPFCDALVLKTHRIYAGDRASILATHKPAVPGHVLIIPNRHAMTFQELTVEEIQEMGELVKKAHAASGETDYLLLQKNGRLAGQSVPHVHIHYLPRSKEIGYLSFVARLFFRPLFKPVAIDTHAPDE